MKKMTFRQQNKILTDEVLRLSKELEAERMAPDDLEEIARVYGGETDGVRCISLGFSKDFDNDDQRFDMFSNILFAVYNMMLDFKGKQLHAGRISFDDMKNHRAAFDRIFKELD